jgi:hypothetical protein
MQCNVSQVGRILRHRYHSRRGLVMIAERQYMTNNIKLIFQEEKETAGQDVDRRKIMMW